MYFGPGAASRSRKTSSVRQNHGQLLRLLHEPEMAGHLRPVARRREKEPQRRHRTVHRRRLHALLALTNLERAQILALGRVR